MKNTPVVTCFLRHRGDVLLLRRSGRVGSYRGRWGGVAGYIEGDDPDGSALREIAEETALAESAHLVSRGESFAVEDASLGKRWIVHPYLFDVDRRDAKIDWESVSAEWVAPTEILRREVVPELWTSYKRVAPTVASIRDDREHGSTYLSVRALEVLRDQAPEAAPDELKRMALELVSVRPEMSVIANRVHRVMSRTKGEPQRVEAEAHACIGRAYRDDEEAAHEAAALIRGKRVFTLSRSGTVVAALKEAGSEVVVAESQPGGEGVGVVEELSKSGSSATLVKDDEVEEALKNVDVVLVGADRLLPNGDVINKVGTRHAAESAANLAIDTVVVSATDKLAVDHVPDSDPWFERTPARLVKSLVTERGVLPGEKLGRIVEELKRLARWEEGID